jgi:hypothetical protein
MKGVPTEFEIRGSLDGTEWFSILKRDTLKQSQMRGGRWFIFDAAYQGPVRYVEFIIRGVNEAIDDKLGLCAALSEFKLFGIQNSGAIDQLYGEKIDLTKAIVRASNSYNLWGHGTGNLYDNEQSTALFIATSEEDAEYYAKFKDSKTFANATDEYVLIRLNGVYKVGRMRFKAWWAGAPHGVPAHFTIEGSMDGENWQTLYTNQHTSITQSGWYNFRFGTKECRYLKVHFYSVEGPCDLGYVAALRELEFYGYVVSLDQNEEDLQVELPAPPSEDEFLNIYDWYANKGKDPSGEEPTEPTKDPSESGASSETDVAPTSDSEQGTDSENDPNQPSREGVGAWPFVIGGVILAAALVLILILVIGKRRKEK